MHPPYTITPFILKLVAAISEKLGIAKALYLDRPEPRLRKRNKIRTIHSSLKIEGNTLSEGQITAILDNKPVIGPREDILEVKNAIRVYQNLTRYNEKSVKSFLSAHKVLMKGLIDRPGQFRTSGVGIVQGSKVTHLAPPASHVTYLMNELFAYLEKSEDLILVKSSVFHYEMEFIHPFADGNGRMGRLWQSVILTKENPIFEYLPFETLISQNQEAYYSALSRSDKAGNSTHFIEYVLGVIDASLQDLLSFSNRPLSTQDRLSYFVSLNNKEFSRKDYMNVFKDISSATASRDLRKGVDQKLFTKSGHKRNTAYLVVR